ncbi:MAG TPA: choice-of-anchor J domain-containing protein, partial [Candidatus Cloacimonadota bacterium]|nr:choice-of-anchor J domain-containing protein [Candidatus Cloacimonadota bacterium]
PWTLVDVDQSATYGFEGITFTNSGSPMAYIIFNPSATTPAVTGADAHGGTKYAASFASTTAVNNDWLISPLVTPQAGEFLNFWARSYVSTYGLERFKVGISTGGTAPADFTIISGATYIQAPVAWTQYSYDLSAYAGQEIRFGIQCVSDDAFIFMVDDVAIDIPETRFGSPIVAQTPSSNASRALVAPGSAPLYDVNGVPGTRTVSSYKIYRDQVFVTEVPNGVLTYTENDVPSGAHVYHVTAMYDQNESPASNAVSVFVMPNQHGETYYDDGTAELGLTLGANRQMAVKHDYGTWVNVKYAKVYVHTPLTAGIIIRLFDNDGPDGLPGANFVVQFQYPATSVVQGWNYIPIPQDAIFDDGIFYIGILETAGAASIGVDTSSFGHSYTRVSAWEPYTEGEIMIRAIVFTGSANEEELNPALTLGASNFPNPFNPETTIAYSVPKNGVTSLKVYNTKGQLVRNLVNSDLTAGMHSVVWNGTDEKGKAVPSGVYFYRVENAGKAVTKKMLLSK